MADEFKRYRHLKGSAADFAANDIVIGDGEIAIAVVDGINQFKIGDGVRTFSQLPYEQVTISTDQDITGTKTFTEDIQLKNQIDGASLATIYATEFLGGHSVHVDSNMPSSSAYLVGRNAGGDPLALSVFSNGGLYYQENLLMDLNGIHSTGIARFNATVYFYQQDIDNGGDLTEYYQIDVNDANGGNRMRIDSPFPDSEVIIYGRNDLGEATFYRFTANGYLLQEYEMDGSEPDNALVTKKYVDDLVASFHP